MLHRLTSFSHRRRRLVIALWGLVLVGGFLSAPALFGGLTSDVGDIGGTESQAASQTLYRAAPSGTDVYAVVDGLRADDPALRDGVDAAEARLLAMPGVAEVRTPWTGAAPGASAEPQAVAGDGKAVALTVAFDPTPAGWDAVEPATEVLRGIDAPRVLVGGEDLMDEEMNAQAGEDLARAELISMPIVLVLLLVLFGGLVAAGLPLVIATVGVAATMAALLLATAVTDVSVYAVNIITMLGLGLAVDYALLVVSRFREERAADPDVAGALMRTFATAGRTVLFSGLTVAASLAGLLVFPDDFLRSMGLAGLAVVLLDMIAALTLLPALLSLVGHRVRPARHAPGSGRVVGGLARFLRGRRALAVVLAVAPLLALAAVPFLGVRYADPDARSLPRSTETREIAEVVAARFDTSADVERVTVVASRPIPEADLSTYVGRLESLDDARSVAVRDGIPGLTVIDLVPRGESQGPAAMQLVDDVRSLPSPVPVQVTGDAAELADYEAALSSRLPWALGIVVLATFVLLFLFTGSVVVPAKAIVMNLLSLGAGFGALVWVFQEGHLGGLVGTDALDSLSITTPVLVFAIAFGLSMDYEVFLLGRISEWWRRTGDNDLAVSRGLQSTARVVTAAALLMSVVFAGFVAGGFSPVKQVGFGLVVIILVDATLVRMLLVPSVMSLMGRANWWAPAPLRRLHDLFGLTEDPVIPIPVQPAAGHRSGSTDAGELAQALDDVRS
jgi:RND superfamily putative drug exporter